VFRFTTSSANGRVLDRTICRRSPAHPDGPGAAPPAPGLRRDPLSRFYSNTIVGRVVVDRVAEPAPCTVLDLGSGSGVLAAAASSTWPMARVIAVDLDPAARQASASLGLDHLAADATDPDLPGRLGGCHVDVVLCNPPFGGPPPGDAFAGILAAAGIDAIDGIAPSVELLFAAQALRLARPGGGVVLVLSDGLATGRRNIAARRALLRAPGVASVTQMPAGSFRRTEAAGYVLSMVKGAPGSERIELRRVRADGSEETPVLVDPIGAATRLDHAFHAAFRSGREGRCLRDLGASVVRGSVEPGSGDVPLEAEFHTTDFPSGGRRDALWLPCKSDRPERRLVYAERGDVLVARLGRRLEEKVCHVAGGWAVPTSAVLRIRMPGGDGRAVAEALMSDVGAVRLAGTARGTGARMLGREDLLDMPLPI
jgi:type I restriction enzyme M protein